MTPGNTHDPPRPFRSPFSPSLPPSAPSGPILGGDIMDEPAGPTSMDAVPPRHRMMTPAWPRGVEIKLDIPVRLTRNWHAATRAPGWPGNSTFRRRASFRAQPSGMRACWRFLALAGTGQCKAPNTYNTTKQNSPCVTRAVAERQPAGQLH